MNSAERECAYQLRGIGRDIIISRTGLLALEMGMGMERDFDGLGCFDIGCRFFYQ